MEFSPHFSGSGLLVLSTCEHRLGDLQRWLGDSPGAEQPAAEFLLLDPRPDIAAPPIRDDWRASILLIDCLTSAQQQWLTQLPPHIPSLIICGAEQRRQLPPSAHWLPLQDFCRQRFFHYLKPLQLLMRSDIPSPLQRNDFFTRLRQHLTQPDHNSYLQVLQCRWLQPEHDSSSWQRRASFQQEFERTVSLRAPAGAIIGRILDDQLVVVSGNDCELNSEWLPLRPDDDDRPWMVYRSSPLHISAISALAAVLQEAVQEIARQRLVQEAQFDWRQQETGLSLLDGIHLALQRNEFYLEFQPQFDSRSGILVGAEALMRWRHPQLGVIPPAVFIQEAENAGIIQALGQWALRETISAWQRLQELLDHPLRMAVNVSLPEIADPFYARQVLSLLQQTGMPPQFLELELTETAMMRDTSVSLLNLRQLKAAGIHIVLDDFGTGFSSLSHLSDLPLSGIKLDRAFVSLLPDYGAQTHIVTSMLELAAKLQLETTAEGVENRACLEAVRQLGCDRIQGYIYARPLSLGELTDRARSGFLPAAGCTQGSLF